MHSGGVRHTSRDSRHTLVPDHDYNMSSSGPPTNKLRLEDELADWKDDDSSDANEDEIHKYCSTTFSDEQVNRTPTTLSWKEKRCSI